MLLAFGMCAALLEAQRSGQGQVVDAAMVDGAASLMTMTFAFRQLGLWTEGRGVNILDTGAHFYEVYDTARRQVVRGRAPSSRSSTPSCSRSSGSRASTFRPRTTASSGPP